MSQVLPLPKTDSVAEAMATGLFGLSALKRRAREVREHYERVSGTRADYVAANAYYYGLK